MNIALIIIVVLVLLLAIWQAVQIQGLRNRLNSVPDDGNVVAMLTDVDTRIVATESRMADVSQRLEHLEGQMPYALSYIGVISYNAFGNIVGNRSRSIALLNQKADGIVITILASREETLFFTKEVRGGTGVEELSPEEQGAVDRAVGR
jgi:signal transduction histidine kinase